MLQYVSFRKTMSHLAGKLEFEPHTVRAERWGGGDQVGQYTLLAQLASGGMGEVWLSRVKGPKGFEKVAAIKRMSSELSCDPDFVEMFADEARLAARLSHPNVVQTFEFNELRGVFYLVMEYLHGESLDTLLRKLDAGGRGLPMSLAVTIAADAAMGLEHAHGRTGDDGTLLGIVHRDISPQNLFVTYEGQVKIVDFGVAKARLQRRVTEVGQVRGKAGYVAPEQLLGEKLDGRADQFALGGVLFEMLTRTRLISPHEREGRIARLIKSEERLPKIRERNPEVPEELALIVDRALERSPEARFPSMAAFGEALRDWLLQQAPSSPQQLVGLMRSLFSQQIEAKEKLFAMEAVPRKKGRSLTPLRAGAESVPRQELSSGALAGRPGARGLAVALGIAIAVTGSLALFRTGPKASSQQALPRAEIVAPVVAPPSPSPEVVVEATKVEAVAAAVRRPGRRKAAMARLTLQTTPWSIVYEGEKRLGETPLVGLALPAGTHQLRLVREEGGGGVLVVEVTLKAGQSKVVRLKL